MAEAIDEVQIHGIRELLAEKSGIPFQAYTSLAEARKDPDSALVLSGDYGGTVFLTAPVRLVACDTHALEVLVSDLDAVTWMSGDLTIATAALERHPVGSGVIGGDGGGWVLDGVWTHADMLPSVVREQAAEVVLGRRSRIDAAVLRECRQRELERKRRFRESEPTVPTVRYPDGIPWDFDIWPPARAFPE